MSLFELVLVSYFNLNLTLLQSTSQSLTRRRLCSLNSLLFSHLAQWKTCQSPSHNIYALVASVQLLPRLPAAPRYRATSTSTTTFAFEKEFTSIHERLYPKHRSNAITRLACDIICPLQPADGEFKVSLTNCQNGGPKGTHDHPVSSGPFASTTPLAQPPLCAAFRYPDIE